MEYLCIFLGITVIVLAVLLIVFLPKKQDDSLLRELGIQRRESAEQLQKNREELAGSIARLSQELEFRFQNQNRRIDAKLAEIETKNEKAINGVQKSVDENLHKSLEAHIGQSFKTVSDRLEQVYKGLGEMQTLANGVGDLKKVLSNVKNRGVWGELQLERLLSQMLSGEQYIKNAATKPGSGQIVEFAIKLPSASGETTLLPIDSKFPIESYNRLIDACDNSPDQAESFAKELEDAVKKSAKDISEKYINPPFTTDYAIMFLPLEGLYCEVARRNGLIELLQQKYKIIISGPTTLTALLSSLQMGFRTVALEKRTTEVWATLSAVKSEFEKFSDIIDSTRKHLSRADDDLEKLLGVRTRAIVSRLGRLEETLPDEENPE